MRLSFRASGRFNEKSVGIVIVKPEGQPSEEYELRFEKKLEDGNATFFAEYPASTIPFTFRARLHDGRTRGKDCTVRFEPRPTVKELNAWLQLPTYVDPDGKRRYERLQPQGEVTALLGCGLRIDINCTKPMKVANLVFLGRTAEAETPLGEPVKMALSADRTSAEVRTDIPAKAIAYRVQVQDDNGFDNLNPPRRGISTAPDDPPE